MVKRGGLLTTEEYVFGSPAILGRFDASTGPVDVDLAPLPEGRYVSRHHARVVCDERGQWLVEDLGSGNGTFVRPANGARHMPVTGPHPLSDGDELALGNARFVFHVG